MTMIRFCLIVLLFTFVKPVISATKAIEPLKKRVVGETTVEEPTWFCIHRLKAAKVWKTLKTPGYPKTLGVKNSRCTWTISAPGKMSVRVAFRGIGLVADDPEHCSSNYLEIIDEILGKSQIRHCGRKTGGDIVSQGNKLRMDLQIDPSATHQRGFSVSYMATKAKPGFYAKKTFNEKALPPMKPKQPESSDREDTPKKKTKDVTKKSESDGSSDLGVIFMNYDRQHIQGHPKNRQLNTNAGFKRLDSSEATSSGGLSTLVIIAIVIGALVGILIIALVFRKLFMNKNSKDKEKAEKKVVQVNSGLPKVNMTHEKVLNAKRNILAPNVIVARNQKHFPETEPEHPPEMTSRWSSSNEHASDPPPDYRKTNHSTASQSSTTRRNPSCTQNEQCCNVVTNRTYEHAVPRNKIPEKFPPRPSREMGGSNKRSSASSPKKMPYRYNSKRKAGPEQKRAIEDLNNERFCEYGAVYSSHVLQHSPMKTEGKPNQTRGPTTRRAIQERGIPCGNSSDSDLSDVFPPETPTRKLKPPESFSQDVHRPKELPGINDKHRQTRLKAGVSKTMDLREKISADNRPVKRRRTIGESREQNRKDIKILGRKSKLEKKRVNINKEDYNLNGMLSIRGRFDTDPPPPSLPRHVVPSSRR